MLPGALTEQIDIPQLAVAAFFVGFIALIIYLRREDRREGYPAVDPADSPRADRTTTPVKVFALLEGGETSAPHDFPTPPINATRDFTAGNALTPTGDPLLAGVGPGAYVMRSDKPFLDGEDEPELQPLRKATAWSVMPGDSDPRGMAVLDARGAPVGTVADIWVDREIKILRYLEVQLDTAPRTVLVPIYATKIDERRRRVRVRDLLAGQFAQAPRLKNPDEITAREEDQVNAYCAGGLFFNRQAGVRS